MHQCPTEITDDAGRVHPIPTRWEICSHCDGEGHNARHLGAYTREEFDESFDYDEQEAYFRGDYDRTCEHCRGSGKVRVAVESQMSPATLDAWRVYWDAEADYASLCAAEQRLRDRGVQF